MLDAPRDATALPAHHAQQLPPAAARTRCTICSTRTRCTYCARGLTNTGRGAGCNDATSAAGIAGGEGCNGAPRAAAPIKKRCTEGGAICSTISSADDLGDMLLTNKGKTTEGGAISGSGRVVSWTPAATWATCARWAAAPPPAGLSSWTPTTGSAIRCTADRATWTTCATWAAARA